MPLDDDSARIMTLSDLIARRDEDWVAALARNRSAALRLLAIGREQAFGAAVEAYGRFLDALADGESKAVLERLLAEADAKSEKLMRGEKDGE